MLMKLMVNAVRPHSDCLMIIRRHGQSVFVRILEADKDQDQAYRGHEAKCGLLAIPHL
jgi:hypothetical protein